jgi:hypothetical protein
MYCCVLCLTVVPLPPGRTPFAVQLNNNNNDNRNNFLEFLPICLISRKQQDVQQCSRHTYRLHLADPVQSVWEENDTCLELAQDRVQWRASILAVLPGVLNQ